MSTAAVEEWLQGKTKSPEFESRIALFIDDYHQVWDTLALASNAARAEVALRFVTNIGVLLNEIEGTPDGRARRGELRDILVNQIVAARRVIELMGAEGGQSPERVAAAIRSALAPGDAMLIRRGGRAGD